MKKYLPAISMILIFASVILIEGCFHNYYKVTTLPPNTPMTEQIQNNNKYFIVHLGTRAWHLKNVSLNAEKTKISGMIEVLPENHQKYLTTLPDKANTFKPGKEDPTYEVHIYISEYAEGQNDQITVPVSAIKKMEIYDLDEARTKSSTIGGIAGIAIGVAAVVGIVVLAATKSSCPLVYINDGPSWHFIGEMYGGAIFSPLERSDFMPLPGFTSSTDHYQIKISNELLERQYTNLAELVVVEHPKHSEVLLDKYGNAQSMQNPQSPLKAVDDKNEDFTNYILLKDSIPYLFNKDNSINRDLSNLILSFKKPLNAKAGKLVLNAKNSYWLDYVYGKLTELYGTDFNKYAENQKKIPKEKGVQWALDQNIPLSVYVDTENGWEFVDYFNVMGPLASRDLIMAIDLSKGKGEDIRIKLECGFMFWEVDYATMDFSENIPMMVSHLVPTSALDEKRNDVSSLISSIDTNYLIQPVIGNEVILKYNAHRSKHKNLETFFLHSRGYYEYIRDFKGEPDWKYLLSFREKGAFTRFARQRYDELFDSNKLIELLVN